MMALMPEEVDADERTCLQRQRAFAPFSVCVPPPCPGDPQAVERLLRYYDNYMNCLCTRTLYDEDGYPHLCVDEYMKRCLEIRLIQAIVKV